MSNQVPDDLLVKMGGMEVLPTGSRIICPQACAVNSDYDFVVRVKSRAAADAAMVELGWTSCTGADPYGEAPPFTVWREGPLNLIVTEDDETFHRWKVATVLATKLGLTHRDHRVLLFKTLLYEI